MQQGVAELEEPVLVPNREKIRQLREARGWKTVDEAYANAKVRGIKLSRQGLFNLEDPKSSEGCRLATLGYILRLYGLPRTELLSLIVEWPEPTAPGERPRKATRPRKARSE